MRIATFYTHVADPLLFACQLAKKALLKGARVVVWLSGEEELTRFDHLLWSFEEVSFVPHSRWLLSNPQPEAASGILLATGSQMPAITADATVLNLTDAYWCDAPQKPQRVLELVGQQDHELEAARQRFRAYRQAGYQTEHHNMARAG